MVHPLKPLPSTERYAAFRADEAAEAAQHRVQSMHMRKQRKYPGRNRVMARGDAADAKMRQHIADMGDTGDRPYACTDPYVVYGIGLPDPAQAIPRYFEGKSNSKIPVEFNSRCRKCEGCLAHRRRLWSARACDELTAANRTWFATLTVNPDNRFLARMHAEAMAGTAGHRSWLEMSCDDQFKYLVKYLNRELDKYFKRLRKGGAVLRYLLVSEKHKDGFPHFHLLIHEPALPVTKLVLESNWRLGYSQFRLVDKSPRSAFYVCKYLAKDAQTRVRASSRYGRAQLVRAATEAAGAAVAATRVWNTRIPGPVPGVSPKE